MGHFVFRATYSATFSIILNLIMLSLAATAFAQTPAQMDSAAITPGEPNEIKIADRKEAWERIDRAREFYLNGELDTAYAILQIAATDTLVPTDLNNARLELTAFVLAAKGEHQPAFDTLQLYVTSRIGTLEEERTREIATIEKQFYELRDQMIGSEHDAALELDEQRSRLFSYLYATAGVILLLLIIIVILALRPRKVVVEQVSAPTEEALPIAPVQTKPEAALTETPPMSAVVPGEPMDPVIMYDHAAQISSQLNKGSTVEAAGHLNMLLRFLRAINEQMQAGHMAIQPALALLRQYLKLEYLRTGTKMHYTVDADRSLLGSDLKVPAMALLHVLARVAHTATTAISVELVPADVGTGSHCVIKYPLGSTTDIRSQISQIPDLTIQHGTVGEEMVIRIHWPEHRSDQA